MTDETNAENIYYKQEVKHQRQQLKMQCLDQAIKLALRTSDLNTLDWNRIVEAAKLFYKFVGR